MKDFTIDLRFSFCKGHGLKNLFVVITDPIHPENNTYTAKKILKNLFVGDIKIIYKENEK